jgi:hypothetical protein
VASRKREKKSYVKIVEAPGYLNGNDDGFVIIQGKENLKYMLYRFNCVETNAKN